ncbi:MAG: hypothetical protein L0H96_08580 [Humibacillus sp.]|nr:hypothetical protein [Humibacillus sp.]MDN5776951.1 hypothetical protein [Humibacillus sp.]
MSEPGVEPTNSTPIVTATETDASRSDEQAEWGEDSSPHHGSTPAPTVIVLTEEALKPVDVEKIVAMHQDEEATYRVLVPADTDRNVLSSFLDHLSLFEMREALDSLRPVDGTAAHADADTALSTTLGEFAAHDVAATGEITADDPMPTLIEEVARLGALEVVVVTEPHAVEDTFHTDWASKAREALGLPVLHMYAGDWRLG